MSEVLYPSYSGEIRIDSRQLYCAVLPAAAGHPLRVFVHREVASLLSGKRKRSLKKFAQATNLQPFLPKDFSQHFDQHLIRFKLNRKTEQGISAGSLFILMKSYLNARKAGVLLPTQEYFAKMSDLVLFTFTPSGIEETVDKATGYQDVSMKNALEKIFDKMLPLYTGLNTLVSPLELYKQWFRLNNWEWQPEAAKSKPGILAKWTSELIYERLSPELISRLRDDQQASVCSNHLHFSLQEMEVPALREFFSGLIALARATANWRKYYDMVNRAYPRYEHPYYTISPEVLSNNSEEIELLSFY